MYAICTTDRSRCPAVRGPNCQTMRRLPVKFAWERPGRLGHDQADDVTGLEPKRLREREYDSEHPSRELLPGHNKLESTVRYLGIEVDANSKTKDGFGSF